MPVQTRHTYNTRHKAKLQHQPQNRELPQKNRRFHRPRPRQNMAELYYSDQDLFPLKEQEELQESSEELEFKAEESDQDSDSNIQDLPKTTRPVLKMVKKCKKQSNTPMPATLNTRSKKIVDEIGKMGTIELSSLDKLELKQPSRSKPRKAKKIVPDPIDLMIPEQTLVPLCIPFQDEQKNILQDLQHINVQEEKEKRMKAEQQMEIFAKMYNQEESLVDNPFLVFGHYRQNIEKATQMEYGELMKKQIERQNFIRTKIDFEMNKDRELHQGQVGNTIQDQKQLINKFQQLNDYLFYKCKQMDSKEQLQYMKSKQYILILQQLTHLHPYQSLQLARPRRKLDLQISTAISQTFQFASNKQQTTPNQEKSMTPLNKHSQQIKMESENFKPAVKQQKVQKVKGGVTKRLCRNQKKQTKNFPRKCQELKFELCELKQERRDQCRKRFQDLNVQDYEKQKILELIHSINQKNTLEANNGLNEQKSDQQSALTPSDKSKTQSNKSQTASTTPIKSQTKPTHDSNQPLSKIENNQIKVEAPQHCQITIKHSQGIRDQVSKRENFSSNSKSQAKYTTIYNDNQSWNTFRRGPKKRLQILNRFQYNPFEMDNGEDQCLLWKRLMSDQIEDFRTQYQYQEPQEYLLNQSEKEYVLPFNVKEQDFYVHNIYDPQTKTIKQQFRQEEDQYAEIVKQEVTEKDGYLFHNQNYQQPKQIQELKDLRCDQVGLYIPASQYEPKFDQFGNSFNYDLLEDLEIPSLKSEKQVDKVREYDF